jgi:tetratricopeptide (TPR) repeat protein
VSVQAAELRPDVFISYASQDLARAEKLNARVKSAGFSVWFDRARLEPGSRWHKDIEAACDATRVMLPLITPRWADSEWTRYETYVHAAVIPVLAEGKPEQTLPLPLRELNGIALDPLNAGEMQWQALFAAIRSKLAEPVPERTARLVDLPYEANPFFTGREKDLVRIHEELHAAPVAAMTQSRVRALAAMGGIGKTTLANEYARRYWRLYPQILWVDARRGYQAEFARLFDLLFPERSDPKIKPDEKAAGALADLNEKAERLLVIDNVEDSESVRPWLPRKATSGCRTLITSRFSDFPQAAGIRVIPLYLLEPELAHEFLVKRTGRPTEDDERAACDALAKELGYLPLALEQAGAYIAATVPRVTFAGYLRLFQQAAESLLARKALGSTDYPDAVIATWQTTAAKLSSEARDVLRLCAWVADTPIPYAYVLNIFDDLLDFVRPSRRASEAETELYLHDVLSTLARYSMILDVTEEGFRVHGLVQAVERIEAQRAGQDADARNRALNRLVAIFPAVFPPEVWPFCRQLMPHQQAVVRRFALDDPSMGLALLLDRAGGFLLVSGHASSALPLFRRTLESRERVMGKEYPRTLASLNRLVECLLAMGDASSALPLIRQALESNERVLGKEHPQTLMSLDSLASCLKRLGDASSALPLFRQALESRERELGKDDPTTLISVNHLADCLSQLGDASSALPLFRRALESSERMLGKEEPLTLRHLNYLAKCLMDLGDASSALPLFRRTLESSDRVLGKEHPDTLISVFSLATCLLELGDASSALPLFRRALEFSERKQGKEDPATIGIRNSFIECRQMLSHPWWELLKAVAQFVGALIRSYFCRQHGAP